MKPYLNLLQNCYDFGMRQKNRTGVDTFMIPGGSMQFNLSEGFPILTTKRVNFDAIKAELIGFIRGCDSAADFRALGTKIWDANANLNEQWLNNPNRRGPDDLQRIYGQQWRNWRYVNADGQITYMDQLAKAVDTIRDDPTSRRIIVSAWQPGELDQMALPPCHLMFQFLVGQQNDRLHMCMYMRSCDMFLGVPFNISSYALLLSLMAHVTGYKPGILTMFLADVHIYENHLAQVGLQLARKPRPRPDLVLEQSSTLSMLGATIGHLAGFEPSQISLTRYDPSDAIKATMAV